MGRNHKEVRDVIRYAEGRGWICEGQMGSGHIRLTHPNGGRVTISSTPSKGSFRIRAMEDIRREERRCQE